jgi:nuclear pore complex protein Nup107
VEEFAKRLDRFHSSIDTKDTKNAILWKEALDLVEAYGSIADSRKSQTSSDLLQARHPSRSRQSLQALAEEGKLEVQRAKDEADLWELLCTLTNFDEPAIQSEYARAQKSCLRSLHRYSTDEEVWQTFLSADQPAEEYLEILRWLHRTARESRPGIDDVTKPLRHKADRGDGIWSAGWLFTKESIKNQKRNRSWPKPLDHLNPGLDTSHVRKSDSEILVAQLDPDAKIREAATLEEQDEYHEQAAWIASWEMLRRGMAADTIRDWWSERKEGWRAVSTRGAKLEGLEKIDREWTRYVGLWKGNHWAAACFSHCRSDAVGSVHEAAVYGLLCGDPQKPLQACHNIDDFLFVNFNMFLIERYRQFGVAISQKDSRHTFQPTPPKYEEVRRLLQFCQHNERTKEESRNPFKTIEGMLVSKDFEAFFLRQGRALSQIAKLEGPPSYLIVDDGSLDTSDSAQAAASDPDALRIIAHQQIILKSLGYLDDLYTKHEEIAENNLAGYIGWLQQEGKMSLIPLYASMLSSERRSRVLGAVIMDITEVRERELMVNLMKKYSIDVAHVLRMQYRLNSSAAELVGNENPRSIKAVSITEYGGTGKAKVLKVRSNFMHGEIDGTEELFIRCLEWYRYGNKQNWDQACRIASTLYKRFISKGRLAAARALCARAQLSAISKAALKVDLTSSEALFDEEDDGMDGFAEEDRVPPISPSKRRNLTKRHSAVIEDPGSEPSHSALAEQGQVWRQLEELVEVMEALEKWNEAAEEVEK